MGLNLKSKLYCSQILLDNVGFLVFCPLVLILNSYSILRGYLVSFLLKKVVLKIKFNELVNGSMDCNRSFLDVRYKKKKKKEYSFPDDTRNKEVLR